MSLRKKVCVIGAGVSGLRAAHKLLTAPNSGLKPDDVIVIEAQDRIGGRIKTDKTLLKLGLRYDLGAAWFHDALTNSVLYSSIKDGSFDAQNDGYFDDKALAYYAREFGGKIDAADWKLEQVVEDIERFIEIHFLESLDVPDITVPELVTLYFDKYGQFLTPQQKLLCGRMCRYFELWYGISSKDISGKYAVMHHQGRNLYNKKGYSFFIEKLAAQLECDVLTNEQVKVIRRSGLAQKFHNVVSTVKGTEIHADYVVVSVPLSILALPLQHDQGITWEPPLPQNVQRAVQSVHFGALGKVIFEFDRIWWDANEDRFDVLPDADVDLGQSSSEGSKDSETPAIEPFHYPIYVVNYAAMYPGSASLVILIQEPVTQYLEANPLLAWEYMKPMLKKIGTLEMSDPINTIVTDWTQNPFARGSYTSLHVGDDPNDVIVHLSGDYETCGLGGESTIRFAGEHTIADGSGCVHGAYDSGERAADWILNHLKEHER